MVTRSLTSHPHWSVMLPVIPLLAIAVVVVAGGSLRKKGRWSNSTFYTVLGIVVLIAIAVAVVEWRNSNA